MKKLFIVLSVFCFSINMFAQAPQRMSYQAVVRNSGNVLVVNTLVGVNVKILQGSSSGTIVYEETHTPTTNTNGLATFEIGGGTIVSGIFDSIDWANGPYFIQTEIDPAGGTNYTITGTSQLMSVPYALYAANGGTQGPIGPQGTIGPQGPAGLQGNTGPQGLSGANACDPYFLESLIVLFNNDTAFGFYQNAQGVGNWLTQSIGGTGHDTISSEKSIVIYNNATAYAFYLDNAGNGAWATQNIGNTGHSAISAHSSIVIYNNSTAYAFHVNGSGVGTWLAQSIGNTGHSSAADGNKIIVWNSSIAHVFFVDNAGNGTWLTQTLPGSGLDVITTR